MVVKAAATTTEAMVESDAGGLFAWGTEAEPTAVTVTADVAEAAEQQPQPDQEPELILPPVVHVKRRSDGEFAIVENLTGKTRAELDHEDRINALSRNLAQACVDESRAVDAAKWAKEVREGCLAALQQAIAEGPSYPQQQDDQSNQVDQQPAVATEEACLAPSLASEGAGGGNAAATPAVATAAPTSPASDQAAYDALLRSAKLADLTLTRDGKKVSLKGTIEKLDSIGIRTIYQWEQLRSAVSTNRPGAEYPARIRRDDLEEAVATWIGKNSLVGLKSQPKADTPKADPPQQPIPAPAVAAAASQAPKADSQTAKLTKPADAKPEAKATETPKALTAADILESQSLLALAMPRPVVEALEADGITTLAKLKMVVDANTFSPKFNDGDRKRIAQRLEKWMAETLPTML